MNASSSPAANRGEGRLWVISLGLSLLVNALALAALGFATLRAEITRQGQPPPTSPAAQVTTVQISREMLAAVIPTATLPAAARPRFANTQADQTAATPPTTRGLSGERNTQATRSHTPQPSAPLLPSQVGIQKPAQDLETTENDTQDRSPAEAQPPPPSPAATTLLSGPNPVAVPIPKDPEPKPPIAKPVAPADPALQTAARKAVIVGSISRSGRSALDVTDTPLGRYQATISRAVEQEWKRNCVRHRNFITPGFLTVRFYVEPSGKVRTVQFVGDMVIGEVQKGFTLSSIREATIPPMPAAIRKAYKKEPLEIIFNFYF
jgi:hypothetical protein